MKLYIGKSEFLQRITIRNGDLATDGLTRKDIALSQVLYPTRPLTSAPSSGSVLERVWEVLNHPAIRRGETADLGPEHEADYLGKMQAFIDAGAPIQLVFIGFPFKSNFNPLKTNRHLPDLGELYFLRRLLEIDATVRQVYPPGLSWVVLTEGEAYQSLVGVSQSEVGEYQRQIRSFACTLGAGNRITFDSLARLFQQHSNFTAAAERFEGELKMQYAQNQTNLPPDFHTMLWTMRQSVDLRSRSAEELYYLASDELPAGSPSAIQKLWQEVTDRAVGLTCRYLALNQAKNVVGVNGGSIVRDAYPSACYVSITSKPGRYAFHALSPHSRFLPHHGVPILVGKRNGYVRIAYLVDVLSKPHLYRAVYVAEDQEQRPFFYHQLQNGNGNRNYGGGWEVQP